jgi:hypothetical protein
LNLTRALRELRGVTDQLDQAGKKHRADWRVLYRSLAGDERQRLAAAAVCFAGLPRSAATVGIAVIRFFGMTPARTSVFRNANCSTSEKNLRALLP